MCCILLEKMVRFDVLGFYLIIIKILRFIFGMLIYSDGRFLDNVLVVIVFVLVFLMMVILKKLFLI